MPLPYIGLHFYILEVFSSVGRGHALAAGFVLSFRSNNCYRSAKAVRPQGIGISMIAGGNHTKINKTSPYNGVWCARIYTGSSRRQRHAFALRCFNMPARSKYHSLPKLHRDTPSGVRSNRIKTLGAVPHWSRSRFYGINRSRPAPA